MGMIKRHFNAKRARLVPKGIKRTKIAPRGRFKPKKAIVKSISKLMKEADGFMSLYVRQKYADKEGNVRCFTCPYIARWKKMQNGHLVSRFYKETRYDQRNCRPQCYTCNMWRNGMTPHFAARLQQELGVGIVEELYEKARHTKVYTRDFYIAVINEYASLLEKE